MSQITVKVRSDIGDPGIHPKFGTLVPGAEITIDENDFGAGLFERPRPEWFSPHELTDQARAGQLKQRVGDFEPAAAAPIIVPSPAPPVAAPAPLGAESITPAAAGNQQEVTGHA